MDRKSIQFLFVDLVFKYSAAVAYRIGTKVTISNPFSYGSYLDIEPFCNLHRCEGQQVPRSHVTIDFKC